MTALAWDIVQLREPLWLLLALQPALVSLFVSLQYRRQRSVYADKALLPWVVAVDDRDTGGRQWLRFLFMQLCWILIALAMAGPRYPDPQQQPDRASAADVMVLVDVSRSMTATDIRPDRLRRVKSELFHFLSQNRSDRIGIILFAGHAHVLSPLTWDHDALRFYAQDIEAGLLPTAGSNLAAAIKLANHNLRDSKAAAILVLTDGETHESLKPSAELLRTPLYIIGVGSKSGTTIAATEGGWLMHDNSPVLTRLQSTQLQALAHSSSGAYAAMTDEVGVLDVLYQQATVTSVDSKAAASAEQQWIELYPWFLVPALLILLWLSLPLRLLSVWHVNAGLITLCLSATLLHTGDASARALGKHNAHKAYTAYMQKNYRQAIDIYAIHSGFDARMGEGASAYQLDDHARAITQFTRAFLVARSDRQRANALYNLANSFFKVQKYTQAQTTYEDVLRYQQQHQAARANLQFVKSVIASLAQDPFASSARAQRAGRGPRSLRADQNTRGSGDFSLDDEEVEVTGTARSPQQGDDGLLDIIASGKGRVQVAAESDQQQTTGVIAPVSTTQLLQARRTVIQAKRDQSRLWKTLFEDEEGFPAPLEQPVTEPGVPPW